MSAGTTMATPQSSSLSLSGNTFKAPNNVNVSPTSSTASSQCSPSSTCSSSSSTGFGKNSSMLASSSMETSFGSQDLKNACSQNGVTSGNGHYSFNNNLSASPPIYPEDKFQNAFSLLQKTLEFLVNEYGVHYALMSCYKTKEKSAVVAISSPGLGGAYFSSKNGPGKDVLESWNQFCKEAEYGQKHQEAEPFSSTQYYEACSDSNSDKMCSPLSIEEHCASPGENVEKIASGLKRPLGVDICTQESDLKKFKTQLELESKKLENSKDPVDPKTFANQLISPENQINLASLGVPFPPRFLTEIGKEGLPNPVLDFSAMKNFAAAAAAAASNPGNLLANNLLAAANLAGPLGMGLPNPLQPPTMIPASMQSQAPEMAKSSFSCASDSDKSSNKNGLAKMGCEKDVSMNSSDGIKREPNASMINGRNNTSPRSSSTQSTPTPEQVLAKGSWMCPQCMKIIKYKRNARAHLMSHAAVRPCFSCSFCDQSFTTKWNLKKHLKLNHGIDMEITDPLMNTGGSPLPQDLNKHALPPAHQSAIDKQRAATALANSAAASAKYFTPLQSPPTMANLNTLAAASAGLYNPENMEAKESNDLKVAQHFYQNFPGKDLLNNQTEATKALQALTSVNMLMQSSLFAEQMLQFGSQFKQDPAAANSAEHHLNLVSSLAQLANQNAVDFSNGQGLGGSSSVDESEESSTNGDLDIDTAPGEEESPLNFADCQASKKSEVVTS